MRNILFLLRHAEAEQDAAGGDIERPLTQRGMQAVGLIGDKLRARGERVQNMFSSTALRAAQTVRGLCPYLGYAEQDIDWRPELYLASLDDLLDFLIGIPAECGSLLVVGHNPGLQNLLMHLALPESLHADKSMSTATLAKLEIKEEWTLLRPGCARLIYLLKPEK